MRKEIDLQTWNRAHIFRSYLGTDLPYIIIGCNLDVTNLYRYAKKEGISFYFSMIYAAKTIADGIENFRYRFENGQPYLIDKNTAFATHLAPGEELFSMVECDEYPTLKEFARKNREKADLPVEESGLPLLRGHDDTMNFSCIPWISYTHFFRTIAHGGEDCHPKVSFGKFIRENDRILMPFSSQTHHGLMDGFHVGKYFNRLEEYLQDEGWK